MILCLAVVTPLKLTLLSARSLLPSSLYLDHSHCPVLAPATLAALPSTRAIETRLLPSFDSCAPAHFDLSVLPIYVARAPAAPFSPLPTAALPSMSLSPNAPFPHSRRVLCRRFLSSIRHPPQRRQ